MKRDFGLRPWQQIAMLLAILALLGSGIVYFSASSLFDWVIQEEHSVPGRTLGKIVAMNGSLFRKLGSSKRFDILSKPGDVFDQDSIGAPIESSARIQLGEGSSIELAAGATVRLGYEKHLTLGGFSYVPVVTVVSGKVTGTSQSQPLIIQAKDQKVVLQNEKRDFLGKQPALKLVFPTAIVSPVPSPIRSPSPSQTPAPKPTPSPMPKPSASPSPRRILIPESSLTPSPTPAYPSAQAELISPRRGEQLRIADGSRSASMIVTLRWRLNTPSSQSRVFLFHLSKDGRIDKKFVDRVVTTIRGDGTVSAVLDLPGAYFWRVSGPRGENWGDEGRPAQASFIVVPDFTGIQLSSPTVPSYGPIRFIVKLSWSKFSSASRYRVGLYQSSKRAGAFGYKTVGAPTYSFDKAQVSYGDIYYDVVSTLPNGFRVHSPIGKISKEIAAPTPVHLINESTVSEHAVKLNNGNAVFTWARTTFTTGYQIEVSTEPRFVSPFVRTQTSQNFLVIKIPPPGRYWWRVQSLGISSSSVFSDTFSFTIEKREEEEL